MWNESAAHGWGGYGDGWWLGGMMHGLFGLVLTVVVIIAGIALARYLWRLSAHPHATVSPAGHRAQTTGGPSNAMKTLELRYAKGDIDRDEFLAKRQDLAGDADS